MSELIHKINNNAKNFFIKEKELFASVKMNELIKNKNVQKSIFVIIMIAFLLTESFAWLYDEFAGAGALLNTGRISHSITQYDIDGIEISDDNEVQTIMYETNMSNVTVGTKYIEVENTGTLDMEFSLAFSLEGHYVEISSENPASAELSQVAGILYYRLYEVTSDVAATPLGTYSTALEAYAAANQPSSAMETATAIPIKNMTLLNNLMKIDTVTAPVGGVKSSKIYRFDYGMYSGVNTSRYSDSSLSIHINAYSSQVGVITAENREGQIWEVQNETQLREILNSSVAGDTIKLMDDINVSGSLNITKRVNLDLNEFNLTIADDLVYEFNSLGDLLIDATMYGSLIVGNDFVINAPKANVTIRGSTNSYDVVVGGTFSVNVLQDGEADGLYLEDVRIVKSTTGLVPIDIVVDSNSRITIGTDVTVGYITASDGSTNIEVINNGNLTQLNFSNMALQATYTKPQIYVYNLGEIYGVLGSYGILLPSTATPYIGPNDGNTLIIKGITSGNITVGGSDGFDLGDIQTSQQDVSVVPIEGEENAYIVYIKSSTDTLQGLLEDYFTNQDSLDVNADINNIKKMIVWTLNAQYFEAADFTYANSSAMSSLEYLSLYNSRVTDGTTNNKIPDYAFLNKTTLKTVILPKTVTIIGDYAFSGVPLGTIPASTETEFNFVTIPSTVTDIGAYAFDSSTYIKFASSLPPTIDSTAFSSTSRIFVANGSIPLYQEVEGLVDEHIYITANLDDDRRYFVFDTSSGLGISYVVNHYVAATASTLGVPETLTYQGSVRNVTEIGNNSYREMNINNTSGVILSLETPVTRIDPYAFYGLNLTGVEHFTNVTYIGDYSFYQTNVVSVTANQATYIGNYAFYNTKVETVHLNNASSIGNYAFYNSLYLYEANVGTVTTIGDYAFYNCPQMQRFYINNSTSLLVNNTEEINLTVGTSALFYNWGAYIDGRLRMYVPDATLASGKTVLSLYKDKFPANQQYIYITGIDIGTYTHLAVPYALSEYTVRTVTVKNYNNSDVTGYEIISYQGADLSGSLPEYLTANSTAKNVISVGEGAYQNAVVATGSTFYIESTKLINISDSAFKSFNIDHVIGSLITTIGASAFEGSSVHYGFFENLRTLGNRAFYNCSGLYRLKLGGVTTIGSEAAAETPNLTSVFVTNTLVNVSYSPDAFDNTGTNIASRFRMYVPYETNADMVTFFRGIYTDLSDYIYPTGTIIGHYRYGSINYDIGEYSVREVTKTNASGTSVTDYEIIEYHGADLTSNFVFPETVAPGSDAIDLSYVVNRAGEMDVSVAVTMTNTSDLTITAWEVDVLIDGGMYGETGAGVTAVNNTSYITFKNGNSTMGRIVAGGTKTVNFHIKSTTNGITDITISAIRSTVPGASTYNVISVGDNAFSHVSTVTNAAFNISSDNLLYVGKNAFANMSGIRHVTLPNVVTLDNYAFSSSSITQGTFTYLNSSGTGVFQNTNNLYILDLGKVQTLGANTITNAPYLYQVLFSPPLTPSLSIDANVFTNIGSSTEDRQRFYVTNGTTSTGDEYVDVYKSHFPTVYQPYFYSYDNIVGDYTPSGLIDTINIGDFSIKNVTINGNSGYEIVEYHGTTIDAGYEFPTLLDINDRYLTSSVSNIDTPWASGGNYVTNMDLTVTNTGTETTTSWKVILNMANSGTIVGVTASGNGVSIDGTKVTITNSYGTGTLAGGASVTVSLHVTFGGPSINVAVLSTKQNNTTANSIPVISIGDYAFGHASFDGTASYEIDSTYLINIGASAFQNNTGIRNINAPNALYIKSNAFNGASNLKTALFSSLTTLEEYAFYNATSLVAVDLGLVTNLGNYAFANDANIARFIFRNSVYSSANDLTYGSNTFSNAATNIGSRLRIYVPGGTASGSLTFIDVYKSKLPTSFNSYVYEIGEMVGSYVFSDYDIGEYAIKTKSINGVEGYEIIEYHGADVSASFSIPNQVTASSGDKNVISIGTRAFALTNITSGVTWNLQIPSNVVYISDYAFYNRGMSTVSGYTLSYIGKYAFAESTSIRSVVFDSVNVVDEYAFYHCTSMTTATLGTGVQALGNYSFFQESSSNVLSRVYINTATPPTIYQYTFAQKLTFWGFQYNTTPTMYVPNNSITQYRNATYWKNYTISGIGLTSGNYIYEVVNDDEVKIVGYTGGSSSLTIPATIDNMPVVQIAPEAFDNASSLTSIKIGQNVRNVGNGFLLANSSVTTITVNSNNAYFSAENGVLYSKDYETLIRFPSGKSVSNGSYTIRSNTKVIASKSFANNTRISNLTFNNEVIAISDSAFTGARALTTVNFNTVIPPYLTGFEFLPMNAGLTINYPTTTDVNGDEVDNYIDSTFYAWYLVSS